MPHDEVLASTLDRSGEAADLDFKSSFNVGSPRDWLELTKDIAAFANSGGGHILVGVNDDGNPSGSDVSKLLAVDPADIGNRLHKYLGQHFAGVELISCEKNGVSICAIRIPDQSRVAVLSTFRPARVPVWEACRFIAGHKTFQLDRGPESRSASVVHTYHDEVRVSQLSCTRR